LSAKELGMAESVFARFDGDGDGQLDSDELRMFLTSPEPTLSFKVAIDSSEPLHAEVMGDFPSDSLKMSSDGAANITLLTTQLSVVRGSSYEFENVEMMIKPQFLAADADANGYLEKSEAERAFLFGATFDELDIDKNGKVYLDEVTRYFQIRFDAARSRAVLTIHEQGRTLFEILDTDRDRRLSFRELKSAAGKLSLWDRDGDGLLSESEIPFQYRLIVSRGNLPAITGNLVAPDMNRAGEPPERTAGPLWFRKMDKNRDGEISKREFLGETATFEKLDLNRDGFIDLNEVFQIVNE
jgi:Ca2+-binding EF-hand superfamily protein